MVEYKHHGQRTTYPHLVTHYASCNLEQEGHTRMDATCEHLQEAHEVTANASGCEDCLKSGDTWVHLRLCLTCGHVGCCDNSKNKHATKHFHATNHPVVESFEPGENWRWCFVDKLFTE